MTNPLTGNWEEIDPTVSPIGFFNPREGISSMMGDITEARFTDSEADRGSDTYEIAGRLPASSLEPLMGNTVDEGLVDVELSIDARNLRLKTVRFIGQVLPSDRPDTVRVIALSRFNEPIDIVAPNIPGTGGVPNDTDTP